MQLIVHSYIVHPDTLVHNVQSNNLARLKQARRVLLHHGYQLFEDLQSEGDYHQVTFWSHRDREYTSVPRPTHSRVLRLLGIPVNRIDFQGPTRITTYATVGSLRRMRQRRPTSPERCDL